MAEATENGEHEHACSTHGAALGADRMAYEGCREDLADWKRRALTAEAWQREYEPMVNALRAEANSPTFMGEPAIDARPDPMARRAAALKVGRPAFTRADFFLRVSGFLTIAAFLGAVLNEPPWPAWVDLTLVGGAVCAASGLLYWLAGIFVPGRPSGERP